MRMLRQRGFSMVELMVAVTLGLMVAGAVISVFVGSRSAYQATAGVAATADAGRFGVDTIQASGRSASYLGCGASSSNPPSTYNMLNTLGSPMAFNYVAGVGGYEATGTGVGAAITVTATPTADGSASDWSPTLDAAFVPATNQEVKNSDVVVFRSSVPRSQFAYTTAAANIGASSFVVVNGGVLHGGQLAVMSDCTKSAVFQISGVTAGTPATVNIAGATGPPGNASIALPFGFSAGALIAPLTTTVYYVGVGADGHGALKRLQMVDGIVTGAAYFTDEEIVPDVDNMQVLYGINTIGNSTGVSAATAYTTADLVADFTQVVSVKVAILTANSQPGSVKLPTVAPTYNLLGTVVTAPIDTRMRRVFETTITLRSSVN